MKNARFSKCHSRSVLSCIYSKSACLNTDKLYIFIIYKISKHSY